MRKSTRTIRGGLGLLLAVGLAAACSDSTGPASGGGGSVARVPVSLSVGLASNAASLSANPAGGFTLSGAGGTISLDQVEVVVREVELEAAQGDCTASSETTTTGSSTSGDGSIGLASDGGSGQADVEDDGCEEFQTGPMLLDLPTDGSVQQVVSIDAPAGTYREVKFEIHKPEDDGNAEDTAFLQANPTFAGISIRVTGTFTPEGSTDAQPFTFESDLNAEEEVELAQPLVVDSGTPANVTLTVDVGTWFLAPDGSTIDPSTANSGGPNEQLVRENIKSSFGGFEDNNRDGREDD